MSHRNLPNTPQRYTHGVECGCMKGHHIWDTEYDKISKHERWCVCCEHFFMSEDAEDNAAEAAIDFPGKPPKPGSSPGVGGFSKGKIKRR